ncbi:MAG: hypothetical protein RR296_03135 [Clostridia bacterium]
MSEEQKQLPKEPEDGKPSNQPAILKEPEDGKSSKPAKPKDPEDGKSSKPAKPKEPEDGKASELDTAVIEGTVEAGEGPYMNAIAQKVNALSLEAWKKWQIAGGGVLGLVCAACLFFLPGEGFLPLNFIVALLVAMTIPNVIEKQLQRKLGIGRTALVIALAATLLSYLAYHLLTGTL